MFGSGEEEEEVCCRCDPFTIRFWQPANLLFPASTTSPAAGTGCKFARSHPAVVDSPRLGLCLNNANCRGQLARKPPATATSSTGSEEDEDGESPEGKLNEEWLRALGLFSWRRED